MVCHLGGISHPPGYPLFTLLCSAIVQSPGVVSGNMISAVLGALAVALLYIICFRLTRDRGFSYVASLAWGFSATFWSQAIIIEVYTLAAFMFTVCWWLLLEFQRTTQLRYWFLLCLAFGLSLSNHWPLMLLSSLGLVAAGYESIGLLLQKLRSPAVLLATILSFIAGLLPYLTLLVSEPTIAVFGGIDSLDGFLRYVSRSLYSDAHAIAGVADKLSYAGWLVTQSLSQAGWICAPLIVIGFVASFFLLPRAFAIMLVINWMAATFLLLMMLNFEYSHIFRAVFKPYPIIAYLSIACWLALGLRVVLSSVPNISPLVRSLATLVVIASIIVANYSITDRRNLKLIDIYTRTVLATLPDDVVLFVSGDFMTGPFGYLHYVEGVREDIELRDEDNLVFSNRLASPFATRAQREAAMIAYITESARPFFFIAPTVYPRIDYGAYVRFNPTGDNGYEFVPELAVLVDLLVDVYLNDLAFDNHEQHFVFYALAGFARQYVGYTIANPGPLPAEIEDRLRALQRTFPGKLVTLSSLVRPDMTPQQKRLLLDMAALAETEIPPFVTRHGLAAFYEVYGELHLAEPASPVLAKRYFEQSITAYPMPENGSICRMRTILARAGEETALAQLEQRFPDSDCGER